MQNFKKNVMFQIRIEFMFFLGLVFFSDSLIGQEISASIQNTYQDKDSLLITLTLQNETTKPLYFIGGVDFLSYKDFVPIRVNYGSFKAEVEARKMNQSIEVKGDIRDTINLVIPITERRYQKGYNGNEIDVFTTLAELENVFCNKRISYEVPTPLNNNMQCRNNYFDAHLYKLFEDESTANKIGNYFFSEQTVVFKPGEKKNFCIDLGYLLLRKATYQIVFDYEAINDKAFKKETKFLKRLGFHRFRGEITSNVIYVTSE